MKKLNLNQPAVIVDQYEDDAVVCDEDDNIMEFDSLFSAFAYIVNNLDPDRYRAVLKSTLK